VGSFFTNVQVHTGERAAAEAREMIVEALRQWVAGAGLIEDASLADEDAERVIMIGPAGPESWIAVYDSATEDQDTEKLHALAEMFSRVGAAAVSVLVHDSDILEMCLCRDGAQIDLYNSFPNYFDEDAEGRAPASGEATRWGVALASGATPEALRVAWETQDLFAEDTLTRVAPLLGWDSARYAVGYRYLPEIVSGLSAFTRLAFRTSTPKRRLSVVAEGPPRLVQAGGQGSLSVPVGSPFSGISTAFRNAGSQGHGLQIVLWGPALDQEIIDVREVHIRCGPNYAVAFETPAIPLVPGQSAEGVRLWHAVVEDIEIPPDVTEDALNVAMRQTGEARQRTIERLAAAQITVLLDGQALAPGEGDLYLGVTPLANPDGQASWRFAVEISRN
jgi:hypothetical protein